MRIEFPFFRGLKRKIRAKLGIKPKKNYGLAPRPDVVKLRDVDPRTVRFPPRSGRPKVSIIIACYGKAHLALNCLASIAEHPPRCTVEYLVVDDASGDPGVADLGEVEGIRLIVNPTNLGFLVSCNNAVALSEGDYVLLLNNDTIVADGAIDALVDSIEATPDAGMVGARLLFPDGRLQEAGGIVWSDGSAWNYGRGDDPSKPEYEYVREADYISGAAILLARAIWDRLGGFDDFYAPAYCEDADLAFRVRALGLKVYYVPTATIYHFEGQSHGTDVNQGVKAYQLVNQKKLAQRWQSTLAADHYPNGQHVMRARDRARHRRIALVIDHYAPQPDHDAGSRTMMEFIHALRSSGWVVKFWPENLYYHPDYTRRLQKLGVETLYGPFVNALDDWLAANGREIDLALLSRPKITARALPEIRNRTDAAIVYYGHDLHFARQQREAEVTGHPEKLEGARKMLGVERSVWRGSDVVMYPSQEEVDEVRRLEPGVAAHVVTAYGFDAFAERAQAARGQTILFVAGFIHPPNVDAATWMVQEILPIVRARHPDARLSLVGSNPTQEVQDLAGPGIEVTGWVSAEELKARYESARVAAVPLRFGAGVKLKVVEAMVEGVPLVTTPVGAQGLAGLADVASVSDRAAEFAAQIIRWLECSDADWLRASRALSRFAEQRFSRATTREALLAAIETAEAAREKKAARSA